MGHIQSMEFSSLNTGVSSRSLFQRIFPTQGSNQGLLHCRQILYQLNYQASPYGYVYYHVWGFCSHCVCSKLLPSTTQVPVEAGLRFEPVRADHGAHTITTALQLVGQAKMKVAQSCLTLCSPMDYAVHGILQARILKWVAFPFSRGSSRPRDQTHVPYASSYFV